MPEPTNYVLKMTDLVARELPGLPAELVGLYVLLALTRGTETTLRDVHDAWAVWRNETRPDHKSLIPFGELTFEVQELDRKYVEGIHRAVEGFNASLLTGR
jgi:hypothetical protein